MDAPAAVRVEELGGDARGYRDGVEERRRVLHVQGSSPRRAMRRPLLVSSLFALCVVCFLVVLVWEHTADGDSSIRGVRFAVLLTAGLAFAVATLVGVPTTLARLAFRRLQWARFELGRSSLLTTTGPWGRRTITDAWAARAPLVISRGDAHFPSWDLAVERADGHRAVLATLYDLESVTHVERELKETYREATSTDARHPFALRFGPIPESVTCEGDPFDPTSAWDLRVRCARGNVVVGLSIALVLALLVAAFAIVSLVMLVLAGLGEGPPSLVHVGSTSLLAICMGVLATATRDQFRTTLLEQFGEVHAHLDRGSIEVTTPPWPMDPLTASGTATLRVEPCAHDTARAWLALVESDGSTQRVHAPIGIDAARYLARIVTLRRETRLGTRTLETTLDSA